MSAKKAAKAGKKKPATHIPKCPPGADHDVFYEHMANHDVGFKILWGTDYRGLLHPLEMKKDFDASMWLVEDDAKTHIKDQIVSMGDNYAVPNKLVALACFQIAFPDEKILASTVSKKELANAGYTDVYFVMSNSFYKFITGDSYVSGMTFLSLITKLIQDSQGSPDFAKIVDMMRMSQNLDLLPNPFAKASPREIEQSIISAFAEIKSFGAESFGAVQVMTEPGTPFDVIAGANPLPVPAAHVAKSFTSDV